MKTKLISLVLALSMLLSLTACGSSGADNTTPQPATTPNASPEASIPPEEGSEQPETYLFTDDLGREVEVPSTITCIAPYAAMAQMVLFSLAPEMFVGLPTTWDDSARGIIADEYIDLPCFGDKDLNVEELALLEPQIIIDVGQTSDSYREEMDTIQAQTSIPTVCISATLETMPETYRTLGKLLGKEEKAEELAQFCEKIYSRTVSIMEQVGDNKVDALYVIGDKGLNVLARDTYHSELLDLLTNNVAVVDDPVSKGSGNEVTMEQIMLWNPDFVIFAPDSIYNDVKNMSPWNQVSAIVNDNYVQVPDAPHNWMSMPPSVQRYLGLIWLTAELYPDYCDYDAKAEIKEYYQMFYGCDLTDEQYDAITTGAFLTK